MVVVVEEEVVEEMVQDVGMMEAVEEEGMAPVTETTIHMPAVAAEGTAAAAAAGTAASKAAAAVVLAAVAEVGALVVVVGTCGVQGTPNLSTSLPSKHSSRSAPCSVANMILPVRMPYVISLQASTASRFTTARRSGSSVPMVEMAVDAPLPVEAAQIATLALVMCAAVAILPTLMLRRSKRSSRRGRC